MLLRLIYTLQLRILSAGWPSAPPCGSAASRQTVSRSPALVTCLSSTPLAPHIPSSSTPVWTTGWTGSGMPCALRTAAPSSACPFGSFRYGSSEHYGSRFSHSEQNGSRFFFEHYASRNPQEHHGSIALLLASSWSFWSTR
ncbi:hypothetical protein PtA15_8A705 [Puccinia triticina]|uniref:Secreted protein n=1 Tax=Puccinia triticina TaxID=208348 RepID=A0ABY7CS87_9BASI|nr:uncharacterized protein PtA15_8A705 [Puccinia triticina]WAQ87798.1 hypothetical protein PtA15_8A705 [Puccinia triticina]